MTDAQIEKCRKRLEQFLKDLLEPVGRSERRRWGAVYIRRLLLNGTAKCPESLCPMLLFPTSGRRIHCLLGGHYSSVVAPTNSFANPAWLFFPSALASFKKSSQVATSTCCHRDLPDVISANLSSDA